MSCISNGKFYFSIRYKNKGCRGSIPRRTKEGAQAVEGNLGFPSESVIDAIFIGPEGDDSMQGWDNSFERIKKIGVLGLSGKTTTAKLIIHFLEKHGVKGILLNTKHILDSKGNETEEFRRTFEEIGRKDIQVVVIEIASLDLNKDIYDRFEFDTIVHTNGYLHHSEEKEIVESLNLMKKPYQLLSKDGIAIINIDDKSHVQLVEGLENNLVIPYGLSSKATLTASSIETSAPNLRFTCCLQRGLTNNNNIEIEPMEFHVSIPLEGRHNVENALAAIAQVLLLGVSPEEISNSIDEKRKYSL